MCVDSDISFIAKSDVLCITETWITARKYANNIAFLMQWPNKRPDSQARTQLCLFLQYLVSERMLFNQVSSEFAIAAMGHVTKKAFNGLFKAYGGLIPIKEVKMQVFLINFFYRIDGF